MNPATRLIAATLAGSVACSFTQAQPTPSSPAAPAPAQQPDKNAKVHAVARAICEQTALVPGTVANIGITFAIEKEWHLYWKGLSDTGMPIQLHPAAAPEGCEWLPQIWPAPHRHVPAEDILDHIYEDRVTIILPVKVGADVKPGTSLTFRFAPDWLVCKEACVLENTKLEITLPVAIQAAQGPDAALFATTRATAPIEAPAGLPAAPPVTVGWDGLTAIVGFPGATSLEFYPSAESSRPTNLSADGRVSGSSIRIRLERPEQPLLTRLDGMLRAETRTSSESKDASVAYYWVSSVNPDAPATDGQKAGDEAGHQSPSPASK